MKKYGNFITQAQADDLPAHLNDTFYPTLAMLQAAGWRNLVSEDAPAPGYRITGQAVQEIDATTAKLIVTASVNIAEEAAAAAAQAAAWKALQSQLDNAQLIEKGVALTVLDELNLLRQWTVAFKAAVAAATTLANLQTRVAALSTLNDRTVEQLKTSVYNKAQSL